MASDFFHDVWDVVRLIPEGRVTSYGAIAKYLGSARLSRMVGWAMNASHAAPDPVPAHRVVNRLGMLSGKAHVPFPEMMQQRLEAEGIRVEDDRVVDFESLYWDPMKELGMD